MSQPRRSLRNYLIAFFIPLTGLPLLVLATLTYILVGRALNQEVRRRSVAELSAISRNLDTVEKGARRRLSDLARSESLQRALLTRGAEASPALTTWIASAGVESVRVFGLDGHLRGAAEQRDLKRVLDGWRSLFGPRPLPRVGSESRDPANARGNAGGAFDGRQRFGGGVSADMLTRSFARFLRREDSWSVKELNARGGQGPALVMTMYKLVTDGDFRPAGYLEARVTVDDAKLGVLAQQQGVDLALFTPGLRRLASSSPAVESKFSSLLVGLKGGPARDLRTVSRELQVDGQPVEFFFGPVGNDAGDPVAWTAVGLYKGGQAKLLREILYWIAAMAIALAGLTVLLTVRVARKITQPIANLVEAADAVKAGEWIQPLEADSRTEMGYLTRRFNEMAQSVVSTKRTLEFKLQELDRAHTALTQTQGQLVQSAKMSSLGQLVAGVAHELNNPIAFIYSNMSQMKQYLAQVEAVARALDDLRGKMNSEERAQLDGVLTQNEWDYVRQDMAEMVQSCLDGSVRVKDIVLGLRSFSRQDKGEVAEVDLNQALRDTARLLQGEIKNRVTLHWDLAPTALVRCNVAQINQVFVNLLANALQAIETRGNLWVSTAVEGEELKITVRDDGRGIKAELLDKIFDPFFTTKKVGEGTGLGLSIVYGIVERHRGSIHVRSVVEPAADHGTEFTLRLPLRADAVVARAS